jgi:hypothetical protein
MALTLCHEDPRQGRTMRWCVHACFLYGLVLRGSTVLAPGLK